MRALLDGSLPSSNSSHVPRPVFDTKHFHLRLKTEQQDFCSKSEMIFPPWSTLIIGCLKLYSPALQCSELLVSRLLFNSSLNPLKVMIKSAAVVSWSLLFFNSTLNSLRKSAAGSSAVVEEMTNWNQQPARFQLLLIPLVYHHSIYPVTLLSLVTLLTLPTLLTQQWHTCLYCVMVRLLW